MMPPFEMLKFWGKRGIKDPPKKPDQPSRKENSFEEVANRLLMLSRSLLTDAGVYDNPNLTDAKDQEVFTNRFTAHLFEAIFPTATIPAYSLNGRNNPIDLDLKYYLRERFPTRLTITPPVGTDEVASIRQQRAIDYAAKQVFRVIAADLRQQGKQLIFVNSFLKVMQGRQIGLPYTPSSDVGDGVSRALEIYQRDRIAT